MTLGSVSGRVAVPIGGPYHASKWALEGMIEALRLELIPFGIRVVLVEPGPYHTVLHDNERLAAAGGGADSPYADLLASYRRQSARLRAPGRSGPLIDVIERAATSENPRLRWPIGPTSLTGGRLRAFCPDRLYEWLMRLAFPIRIEAVNGADRRAIIVAAVPSDKLTRREVDFVLRRAAEIDTQSPTAQRPRHRRHPERRRAGPAWAKRLGCVARPWRWR